MSSNGNIFRVLGTLCGEFTGPGEFPAQRPVTRSFDAFFDLRPNKRLNKQPWGWWFETPAWSLWRQCNVKASHNIPDSIFFTLCLKCDILYWRTFQSIKRNQACAPGVLAYLIFSGREGDQCTLHQRVILIHSDQITHWCVSESNHYLFR